MEKRICIAILAMGFSGLVAEILLLRELMVVFSGNELCIGIILSNWLILEAFGCFFIGGKGGRNKLETFTIITTLFSLSFPAAIFFSRILKRLIGVAIGESIGFLPMFYSSFIILLPVSVLHGALFTSGCRIYSMFSAKDASSLGRVYVYESVGTIIGGVVCTYLLIPYLNSFQVSLWIAILNFAACLVLIAPGFKIGMFQKTIVVTLGVMVFFSGYFILGDYGNKLHDYSIKVQWKNHNIACYQNSRYSNICVIENQGQYIFFVDGMPHIIIPVPDIPFIEEFVHIPLLFHHKPEKLLILSGGAGGIINEALKHPSIEAVEYAELDPMLLDLLRKFPTPLTESELSDRRVRIKHMDGRLLLKTTRNKYDLILIGILEPSNLQTNRFFTKEFFSLAKKRLNKGGILVIGLPGSLTFINKELKDLNSCIFSTLKEVFHHIRVIPGDGRNLFLSSDSSEIVSIDSDRIIERVNQRSIKSYGLLPWHIEKKLHQGWTAWFSRFIEGSSEKINFDFKPVGMFYSISHWNSLFAPSLHQVFKKFEGIKISTVLIVFFVLYLIFLLKRIPLLRSGIPLAIFTTGFSGMIFDLILIFTFQSIYGYVFSWVGLLVTFFMAGAACGAMAVTIVMERIENCLKFFIKTEALIIFFSIVFPFVFLGFQSYLDTVGVFFFFRILLLFISFICGVLTGCQFPLANKIYQKNSRSLSSTAGLLYASDLLGGWLGGVIGGVVLLPVLGLTNTCIIVLLFKLTSFIVVITHGYLAGGEK